MAKPQKPQDAYVVNGWYMNLPITGIGSDAIFETLAGLNKSTGVIEVVDAGTNKKYKFNDQLIDFGEMTLTRCYNGTSVDTALETLANTMIETGLKIPVTAVKMHHGVEVFTIVIEGFSISAIQHPDLDINSGEKYIVSYTAHCDGWTVLPAGA